MGYQPYEKEYDHTHCFMIWPRRSVDGKWLFMESVHVLTYRTNPYLTPKIQYYSDKEYTWAAFKGEL